MKSIGITIFFLFVFSLCAQAQVAIIAHKDVPAETLSQTQIWDFYAREVRFWNDKIPVVVCDLKPSGEVKDLFYKFLGKTPSRMKSLWLKKMLMGEGEPPEAFMSEEEMLKKVASTPGAIGFVGRAKINSEVKIILVIEKNDTGRGN